MRVSGCSVRCGQHVTIGALLWVDQSLQGFTGFIDNIYGTGTVCC